MYIFERYASAILDKYNMNNIKIFENFDPKGKTFRVEWSWDKDQPDQADVKIMDGTTVIFEINGNGFFQENGIAMEDTEALENFLKTEKVIGPNDKLRK